MAPSLIILILVALAALGLTVTRPFSTENVAERRAAARALTLAVAAQTLHFTEEASAGLPQRFPALFGLPGVPLSTFVVFNLIALGVWVVSIPGLRFARPEAFFAAWFLAIAGMFNGVAHPLFAIVDGGYFPGLVSSPFTAAASVWLWLRLCRATAGP